MKTRPGQVRSFKPSDFGGAAHGWKADKHGNLVNPKGWAALHVVVQKLIAGTAPEEATAADLYDQLILVESPGAIVVCRTAEEEPRCALVQNFRFTSERLSTSPDPVGYIANLAATDRWDELLAELGQWHWELPRGLAPPSDERDLTKFVLNCAKVEAAEESGLIIVNPRVCGRLNASTTFFAHSQYVVAAEIQRQQVSTPEPFEMLGKTKLFTKAEIRALMGRELVDSFTIAALTLGEFF